MGQGPLATGVPAGQPEPPPLLTPFASIAMTVATPSTNGVSTTSRPAPPRPAQRPPSALELIRSANRAEKAPAPGPSPASATSPAPEAPQAPPDGFSPEQLAAAKAKIAAIDASGEHGANKVVTQLEPAERHVWYQASALTLTRP